MYLQIQKQVTQGFKIYLQLLQINNYFYTFNITYKL